MRLIKLFGCITGALVVTMAIGIASASATKLCKVEPAGNPLTCPAGEGYVGEALEAALEPATVAKFVGPGLSGEVTCNESKMTAKLKENGESPAKGGIETAEFKNGGKAACPSTLFGKPEVEVKVINLPYAETKATYLGAAAPQGELEVKPNVKIQLRVLTEAAFICGYVPKAGTVFKASLENATAVANAKAFFNGALFSKVEGPAACLTEGAFTAKYEVRRTNPNGKIWIAN